MRVAVAARGHVRITGPQRGTWPSRLPQTRAPRLEEDVTGGRDWKRTCLEEDVTGGGRD